MAKQESKATPLASSDVKNFLEEIAESSKGVRKGSKKQISLTIASDLLEKADVLATKMGLSRAALINMAIYQAVVDK